MHWSTFRELIWRAARQRPILRGFTLIELVIVACILAIMAGIALPRFGETLTRRRVEAAAGRVAADLNLARRSARSASTARTVTFNVAAGSYSISGLSHPDHPTLGYAVRLAEPPYEVRITSADFGGANSVTFSGYGTPGSGGTIVLDAGGYQGTVTLDANSGQASITAVVAAAVN